MKHIHLPDTEPRCRNRARSCDHQDKCARNRATLPAKNASVGDFSLAIVPMPYIGGWCQMFKAVTFDKPAAVAAPVKRAIGAGA